MKVINYKALFGAATLLVVSGSTFAEGVMKKPASANGTNHFAITGMVCESCSKGLTSELRRVPGVVSVNVSLTNKLAIVACDTNKVSTQKLLDAIKEAGLSGKSVQP